MACQYSAIALITHPAVLDGGMYYAKKVKDTTLPGDIILGNPASNLSFTAIVSPSCQHCAESLRDILQLVSCYKSEIFARIRIICYQPTHDSPKAAHDVYRAAADILAQSKVVSSKEAISLLIQCIEQATNVNLSQHKIQSNTQQLTLAKKELEGILTWSHQEGIDLTPTFLMPGFKIEVHNLTGVEKGVS